MPRLGDVIGALLSDAAQARMQADQEAVRIARAYSQDELLRHLPVPRFRLPEITVDLPLLVSGLPGPEEGGIPVEPPSYGDVTKAVNVGLRQAGIRLPRGELAKVASAAFRRAKEALGEDGRGFRDPVQISGHVADTVGDAVVAARDDLRAEQLEALRTAVTAPLQSLLTKKIARSPNVQVLAEAGEIKAHGDDASVLRVRLTITEEDYEVVDRDADGGFLLTPE